jgi:hypothetical protein
MTATSALRVPGTESGHAIRRTIAFLIVLAVVAVAFVIGRVTVQHTHTTRTVTVFSSSNPPAGSCLTVHRGPC